MRAIYYAQALLQLSNKGSIAEETLLTHFQGTLKRNGHMHLLPQILRSYEKLIRSAKKKNTVTVVGAKPMSSSECAALLKTPHVTRILDVGDRTVTTETDSSLIGGAIVRVGSKQLDQSYKRMLLDLYQTITVSHQ